MDLTRRAFSEMAGALLIGVGVRPKASPRIGDDEPKPVHAMVGYLEIGSTTTTAITRMWNPGDTEHCKRCPTCTALYNVCTIMSGHHIPKDQVREYRCSIENWQRIKLGTNQPRDQQA